MFALVVLAAVAALVGALGTLLAALADAGRRDSRHGSSRRSSSRRSNSRHRGGAAAVPRAAAATVSLLVAAVPLLFAVEPNRLGLAAVALWWLSLPWLAVTSRLGAWAHAAWTHAVSAAALGLVDLAWQATTQQRPLLPAIGVWALWLVAAATAVVVLLRLREVASSGDAPRLVRLRPAVVTAVAVCGVGAAAVSFAVQQPTSPASVEASSAAPVSPSSPVQGSTPGATPAVPTIPAPTTTAAARESQAAARSAQRTATPTSSTARSTPSSTTTSTRSPAPSTTTSPTSTSPTTTTTAPINIKIWPSNNPHTTPPGHR